MTEELTVPQRENLMNALVEDRLADMQNDPASYDFYIREWLIEGHVGYADMTDMDMSDLAESRGLDLKEILSKEPEPQLELLVALIALMKSQIREDIGDEVLPRTVASFSELHGYVDANCYGHLCDEGVANSYIQKLGGRDEEGGTPEAFLDLINAAQTAIDVWLRGGRNG